MSIGNFRVKIIILYVKGIKHVIITTKLKTPYFNV